MSRWLAAVKEQVGGKIRNRIVDSDDAIGTEQTVIAGALTLTI